MAGIMPPKGTGKLSKEEEVLCNVEKQVDLTSVILTVRCRKYRRHLIVEEGVERNWHRVETLGIKFEWLD